MNRPFHGRQRHRNPIALGLLICMASMLLIVVVVLLLTSRTPGHKRRATKEAVAVTSGQTVTRNQVDAERRERSAEDGGNKKETSNTVQTQSTLPPPPEAIGDSRRIRQILQPGKTYRVITHLQLHTPVREKDWAVERTETLNYYTENVIERTIEKNSGTQIQEVRYFSTCRVVSLTSTVNVEFKPPVAATIVFGAADLYFTGGEVSKWVAPLTPVVEEFLTESAQSLIDSENARAKAMIQSLEGKKVRLVYRDGEGVVSLSAVDCELTEEQRDFIFSASVVSDAYVLPDVESRPGDAWDVQGHVFADILPPSWYSTPQGIIRLRRSRDYEANGKQYARLEISGGTVYVDATDVSRRRVGRFTPRGFGTYNITDGHVEVMEGKGGLTVEEVSRDHILFEYRFESAPELQFTYNCRIVE